jgi:RNA polymerase sigma-70 factor (ECF subfamily)
VGEITRLLAATAGGDRQAYDELFQRVYDDLRRTAGARMRGERREHTLTPTALVHETYLKMLAGDRSSWKNRSQFFAIAARAMRQILVDHALRKQAEKRGGGRIQVTFDEEFQAASSPAHDVLVLEEALSKLEKQSARKVQVVVCRFFGGMAVKETAKALGISEATVKRDWTTARAWLNLELKDEGHKMSE